MVLTKELIEQIIKEEIEKELTEGPLDFLKGAASSAGGKLSQTGKNIAKVVS